MGPLKKRLRHLAGRVVDPTFAPAAKARSLRLISRSRVLTTTFFFARAAFSREQWALVSGMAAYYELEADRSRAQVYRIRRDVHRIEKGLASSPRRQRFAEGFIEPLVAEVARLRREIEAGMSPEGGSELLEWADDVLGAYFEAVSPSEPIAAARARFEGRIVPDDGVRIHVPSPVAAGPSPVDISDLAALARRRHSVRHFLDRPVSRDLIDAALDVARQSPSACNRQAFEFRIYDESMMAAELARIAPGFDPQGRRVPAMVVVVGRYRAYFRERDMHVIYIDASLAIMGFVLALESMGLASCCINWPSIPLVDAEMSSLIGLDDDEEVVMLLAVGHPDPEALSPNSRKVPLEAIRRFNP